MPLVLTDIKDSPFKDRKTLSTTNRDNISLLNPGHSQHISQFSFAEKDKEFTNLSDMPGLNLKDDDISFNDKSAIASPNGKDFLGKKRKHLTRIYQNIIDKKLTNKEANLIKTPKNESKNGVKTITGRKEKENIKDIHFSTYEV